MDFFLAFEDQFFFAGFRILLGCGNDPLRFDFGLADFAFSNLLAIDITGTTADETTDNGRNNNSSQHNNKFTSPSQKKAELTVRLFL